MSFFKVALAVIGAVALVLTGSLASQSGQTKLVWSFFVGFLGSVAYITALYFKFIGLDDKSRSIILKPFCGNGSTQISLLKCLWYGFVGGAVATVFQVDVPNFVAIQSLILGATWPAVVAQFLSGRLAAPTREEGEAEKILNSEETKLLKQSDDSTQGSSKIKTEAIDVLIDKLSRKRNRKSKAAPKV